MNKIALTVDQRTLTGKGPARRLRAEGKVPAVIYGKKMDSMKLSVDYHTFKKSMDQAGTNPLFDLNIAGGEKTETRNAILKERQANPITGALVHLDFVEIYMDEAIEVNIPLNFTGKPIGVEAGGLFQGTAREILVSCLPDAIPGAIDVDISELNIGDSIHIGQVELPEGATAVQDPAISVAAVVTPKRGEVLDEEEVEEGAEELEGEEGEGEEGEKSAE